MKQNSEENNLTSVKDLMEIIVDFCKENNYHSVSIDYLLAFGEQYKRWILVDSELYLEMRKLITNLKEALQGNEHNLS